jgi:Fic family protein
MKKYPQDILKRALSYLYTKETKSSFVIENISPTSSRVEKFVAILKGAHDKNFCTKKNLIDIQNSIVDKRFACDNYRKTQNYVGESVSFGNEKVHYIPPKPQDVETLMEGLIQTNKKLSSFKELSVICATIVSYGFVFIHPFEDGNGRIHRFLLHNILSIGDFTPKGIIFPISAVMLKNLQEYDKSLESFSSKLLPLIDYKLDEEGRMEVNSDTKKWYQYIDMTKQVEAVYKFIEETIEDELSLELDFLLKYDISKKKIQEIVDMPDRYIDLFIRFVLQNGGRLSKIKREKYFDFLSDEEVRKLEEAIAEY